MGKPGRLGMYKQMLEILIGTHLFCFAGFGLNWKLKVSK